MRLIPAPFAAYIRNAVDQLVSVITSHTFSTLDHGALERRLCQCRQRGPQSSYAREQRCFLDLIGSACSSRFFKPLPVRPKLESDDGSASDTEGASATSAHPDDAMQATSPPPPPQTRPIDQPMPEQATANQEQPMELETVVMVKYDRVIDSSTFYLDKLTAAFEGRIADHFTSRLMIRGEFRSVRTTCFKFARRHRLFAEGDEPGMRITFQPEVPSRARRLRRQQEALR